MWWYHVSLTSQVCTCRNRSLWSLSWHWELWPLGTHTWHPDRKICKNSKKFLVVGYPWVFIIDCLSFVAWTCRKTVSCNNHHKMFSWAMTLWGVDRSVFFGIIMASNAEATAVTSFSTPSSASDAFLNNLLLRKANQSNDLLKLDFCGEKTSLKDFRISLWARTK